ncbi:MAG: hypothetical protein AAF911_00920 [Planctomycetota bacterium]
MKCSYELMVQDIPCRFHAIDQIGGPSALHIREADYRRADKRGIFTDSFSQTSKLVTPWAKQALSGELGEWVRFEPIEVKVIT